MSVCRHFDCGRVNKAIEIIRNHSSSCKISKKFVCVDCSFEARDAQSAQDHAFENSHFNFIAEAFGELYCTKCRDYHYRDNFDTAVGKKRSLDYSKAVSFAQRDGIVLSPKKRAISRIIGICNMGSTCFLNSILQALIHNSVLSQRIGSYIDDGIFSHCLKQHSQQSISADNGSQKSISCATNGCIACEMKNLFVTSFDESNLSCLVPSNLLYSIWLQARYLAGYDQQDAHEFYIALLDGLSVHFKSFHRLKGADEEVPCLVKNIFSGLLRSEVQCLSCSHSSKKDEIFSDISVSIDIHEGYSTLEDCLHKFTEDELLSDPLLCEGCSTSCHAIKRLSIANLPQTLTIHFKRFDAFNKRKINSLVSFPLMGLDMQYYISKDIKCDVALYDLFAVVSHIGSLHNGHYIAYVLDRSRNKWIRCDDDKLMEVDESVVQNCEGYLLFYSLRGVDS